MDIFQKVWAGVFLFDFHLLVIVGLDALLNNLVRLLRSDPFVEIVVAHQHRRGAATGQALDEFNRKFPVLGRLDAGPGRACGRNVRAACKRRRARNSRCGRL